MEAACQKRDRRLRIQLRNNGTYMTTYKKKAFLMKNDDLLHLSAFGRTEHCCRLYLGMVSMHECQTKLNLSGPGLLCNSGPLDQDCQKEHQGGAQPQYFLWRKRRFDRHHARAMPRVRSPLGTLVGCVKGLFALSFSPDVLATLFFLVLFVPELLYFSMQTEC